MLVQCPFFFKRTTSYLPLPVKNWLAFVWSFEHLCIHLFYHISTVNKIKYLIPAKNVKTEIEESKVKGAIYKGKELYVQTSWYLWSHLETDTNIIFFFHW